MKLTRNLKILIFLIFSAYLIQLSNSLTEGESSTNTIKESNKENEEIFSMKHKKIRTATTAATKKTQSTTKSTTQAKANTAKTNTNAKSNLKTNTNTNVKNTNSASAKNKQFQNDLMGANSDLLKQTGLLAAAYASNNQKPPGFKNRIDLEKMGPIAFHSWVKFFKYTDQVATDKNAKLRFNQNRKFFTNGEFREQLKLYPGQDYQEKDDEGEFKYVSSPNDFYLVAFKHSVVIYQTKMVRGIN